MVGELARTRKELRACIEGTRNTLRLGTEDDPALGEALALLGRLDGHYKQLDGELSALMSGEPDRARIAARMPELRKRAADIKRSADALRFAAQERAGRHDAEDLDSLHRQIDMEASALRHWTPAEGPDGAPGAGAVPGAVPGTVPQAEPSGLRKPPDSARELRDVSASPASPEGPDVSGAFDVPGTPAGAPGGDGSPGASDGRGSRPIRNSQTSPDSLNSPDSRSFRHFRRFRKAEEEA